MPVDSGKIMAALGKRYRAPMWALLEQVGNGTGTACNRYADALALSLWPSRGIELHGFEVKVYRNDWLRELKRPDKAEDIANVCDFWWIAAAPGVVDVDRDPIPTAWGVMILDGRGLVQHKKAERRPERAELDRYIIAAIMRRATERMVPVGSIQARLDEAREEGEESGRKEAHNADAHENELRELAELRESIASFQAASGLEIKRYCGAGDLGRRVKMVETLDQLRVGWTLKGVEQSLTAALEEVRKVRAVPNEAPPEGQPQTPRSMPGASPGAALTETKGTTCTATS
jgi:hypothetical protein